MISYVGSIKFKENNMIAVKNKSIIEFMPILSKYIEECIMNDVSNTTYDEIMQFIVALNSTWVGEVFAISIGNFLSALMYKLMLVFSEIYAVNQPEELFDCVFNRFIV